MVILYIFSEGNQSMYENRHNKELQEAFEAGYRKAMNEVSIAGDLGLGQQRTDSAPQQKFPNNSENQSQGQKESSLLEILCGDLRKMMEQNGCFEMGPYEEGSPCYWYADLYYMLDCANPITPLEGFPWDDGLTDQDGPLR
tara:strand:+ start:75 stop:497 length:423 start_codon:yes stop_codon:yes gene_type:complete